MVSIWNDFVSLESKIHLFGKRMKQECSLTPSSIDLRPFYRNGRKTSESESINCSELSTMPMIVENEK